MIRSKFTYCFRSEPDKLLMYNSLRGASSFIEFAGADAVRAENCVNSPDKYSDDKVYQILAEYGMIIPEETKEELIYAPIHGEEFFLLV